jgi:hypothetical protein
MCGTGLLAWPIVASFGKVGGWVVSLVVGIVYSSRRREVGGGINPVP